MLRIVLLLLFLFTSVVQAETAASLRVAVAANFINVMDRVAPMYTAISGPVVQSTYGATGKLYAQIKNGAPYDLFLAADRSRPQLLYEAGVCETPFPYAYGSVVLWSWDTAIKADKWQDVLGSHQGKIAIANPATAPYGTKAHEVMQKAGLVASITPRLVYGQSVGQTFVFVQTENTRFGFVALSQALSEQGRKGQYWPVVEAEHVDQWGCVVKRSENTVAAQQLVHFFTSEDAKKIFHNLGYRQ